MNAATDRKQVPIINTHNPIKEETKTIYAVNNFNLWYGESQALYEVNMAIPMNKVTAIIGPSGCGKSTFIKALNRMVELVPSVKMTGTIKYNDKDIFNSKYKVEDLRTRVGMVFQNPNPFPKSIYENVVYGPKTHGIKRKKTLDEIAEKSLKEAALWDEVKDRLHANAFGLSGGQQQRLCIARCLAIEPDVILMDEPTSALDPISTTKIEELVQKLKKDYSIAIVTHNMQQAARISDKTAFFLNGEVIEYNNTDELFSNPEDKRTEDYITGRFG
ncbi:phosphate ABC transporter ATP-binding protein PstB [Lentibacillus cibarius]|uniref:Phosphate ABC transporter ATP-binding protein n=1 Tax=Lentibacillus cibarius TaxID=2583219 RepID=A0A5S3QL53_9BACI|nr:phosphate ABC transporter ATP-binding protein PstB [Lentibacillus cibarius]TMN22662.1 phosphate ABC transporter ATP-binding protein [Lentibacillus cibarius]